MSDLILETLAAVAAAQKTVSYAQTDPAPSDADKSLLLKLYWALDDIQQRLILQAVTSQVQQLTDDSTALRAATQQLGAQLASLNAVAADVNAAASAVAVLVKAASAAETLGIA
jgi:putative cell wall-binding protein